MGQHELHTDSEGRSRRYKSIIVWTICMGALLLEGCRGINQGNLLRNLLLAHGFVYVWETRLSNGQYTPVEFTVAHGTDGQVPPKVLDVNHAYLFYPENRKNFEELALHSLPAWISDTGCYVLNGPTHSADLVYPYVGGPTFQIEFSCQHEEYELRAIVDSQLGSARGMTNTTALVLIRKR